MIAPIHPTDTLLDHVRHCFAPGGRLAQAFKGEGQHYESRPQQTTMAEHVAGAVLDGRHLAVEAGTGVGKSFAYLAPLIHYALATKKPVAISTHTINLQEQLILKDIPFLRRHLGVEFEAALCKGRSNYVCLRRLSRARQMGGDLFQKGQERELDHVREWSEQSADGSLSDFSEEAGFAQPRTEVWREVCSEYDNCLARKCPFYNRCFLMKARGKAWTANLLVLNHHLFFSDLALKADLLGQSGDEAESGILPEIDTVVLDEAHRIEDVASEHLGLRITQGGLEYWLRRLYTPNTGKGLLSVIKDGEAAHRVSSVWDAADHFFKEVHRWAGFTGRETRRVVSKPMDVSGVLLEKIAGVVSRVNRLAESVEDADLKTELKAAVRRGGEIRAALDAFLKQSLQNHVYWVEWEGGRRKQMRLQSAPIEVGPLLDTLLFQTHASVVMTSATLSVDGSLEYFKQRVGAGEAEEKVVGSPFNYSRQMRVYIAGDMPMPSEAETFVEAVAEGVRFFVKKTAGRAFVLFTSQDLMRSVADRLAGFFTDQGMTLLMQGEGLPRHRMLERFKTSEAGVLFGLDSFWMGVDVRGDALSNVIIVRLPFTVPDEPVTRARMNAITARGGDAFRDYSLPEAVLKFRQGVGRLIRTATDEGIVAILDSRIIRKSYGRIFLRALPECPVEIVELGLNSGENEVPPF